MATMAKERVSVAVRPRRSPEGITWSALLWIGPAVLLLLLFFIYPMIRTIRDSLWNADSTQFVGLKNYGKIFSDPTMLTVLRNNLICLVLGTILTVGLGLTVA